MDGEVEKIRPGDSFDLYDFGNLISIIEGRFRANKKMVLMTALTLLFAFGVMAQIEPAVGIRENTPAVHALKKSHYHCCAGKEN